MRAAVGGGKLPLLKVSRELRILWYSLGGRPSSRSWHTSPSQLTREHTVYHGRLYFAIIALQNQLHLIRSPARLSAVAPHKCTGHLLGWHLGSARRAESVMSIQYLWCSPPVLRGRRYRSQQECKIENSRLSRSWCGCQSDPIDWLVLYLYNLL